MILLKWLNNDKLIFKHSEREYIIGSAEQIIKNDLKNYDDCGCILYDINNQNVYAGASGPTSSGLTLSYIISNMRKKKYKRVLLVATGALMSPTMMMQKNSIPAISHAVSLEVI